MSTFSISLVSYAFHEVILQFVALSRFGLKEETRDNSISKQKRIHKTKSHPNDAVTVTASCFQRNTPGCMNQ